MAGVRAVEGTEDAGAGPCRVFGGISGRGAFCRILRRADGRGAFCRILRRAGGRGAFCRILRWAGGRGAFCRVPGRSNLFLLVCSRFIVFLGVHGRNGFFLAVRVGFFAAVRRLHRRVRRGAFPFLLRPGERAGEKHQESQRPGQDGPYPFFVHGRSPFFHPQPRNSVSLLYIYFYAMPRDFTLFYNRKMFLFPPVSCKKMPAEVFHSAGERGARRITV